MMTLKHVCYKIVFSVIKFKFIQSQMKRTLLCTKTIFTMDLYTYVAVDHKLSRESKAHTVQPIEIEDLLSHAVHLEL